jgi:acylphosphatase
VKQTERIRLRAYGGVQGVGFRAYVRKTARALGLCGYVRNVADGSVEIEASGNAAELQQLRDAVKRGPPYASVERVEDLGVTAEDLGSAFEVRY